MQGDPPCRIAFNDWLQTSRCTICLRIGGPELVKSCRFATPSPVAETVPTVEQSSMVRPAVDTSAEAVERLVRDLCAFMGVEAIAAVASLHPTIRALLAERDAAVARASEHGAYRSAASAFLASKQLLPEFDAWCEARGMPADAVGRLVEVARLVSDLRAGRISGPHAFPFDAGIQWRKIGAALDALPPGILDQPSGR